MTILEKTPTRLIVQSGPNGGRFMFAVFMLVISGFMIIGPQSTVFSCQRHDDGSGQCTLNEYRLIGSSQLSFKLEAIQAVTIETRYTTSRGNRVTMAMAAWQGGVALLVSTLEFNRTQPN